MGKSRKFGAEGVTKRSHGDMWRGCRSCAHSSFSQIFDKYGLSLASSTVYSSSFLLVIQAPPNKAKNKSSGLGRAIINRRVAEAHKPKDFQLVRATFSMSTLLEY